MEAKKQEEALRKETDKARRQQKAAAQKEQVLERRRQRHEERERKRQNKEARKQRRDINQHVLDTLKEYSGETPKEKQLKLQEEFGAIDENERTQDEMIVALPSTVEPLTPSKLPSRCEKTPNKEFKMASTGIAGSKGPSLVVESAREMVVSYRDSGRPQRNSKRPRWLEGYDMD
ncbi:hypothetical protein NLG97_g9646 [Lecanicillium saksenae]|uniref:Uncharacterized protein n=1 Tax=Lecanicillium saksenae TaxID=468837 RepID=A0ACC1QIF2_9HYPO|nr:hypothetical protein NLG97_g9646 [Lecanicillium saksenae]